MAGRISDSSSFRTDNLERARAFPVQEVIRLLYRLAQPDADPQLRENVLKVSGCKEDILQLPPYELSRYLKSHPRNSAMLLMILEISACRICDYYTMPKSVSSYRETARLFMRHYLYRPYEQLTAAACDSRYRITDEIFVSQKGRTIAATASARDLIRYAVNAGASSVIIAHNHPVAAPEPSQEDVLTTENIAYILGTIGITLADHIIISGSTSYSMRLSGEFSRIFGTAKLYKDTSDPLYSFIGLKDQK